MPFTARQAVIVEPYKVEVREVTLPRYAGLPRYAQWLPFNIRAAYRYLRKC